MSKSDSPIQTGGGVGFSGLLTIVFITLKLTGYIHWSWIWVLSPLWIGLVFALVVSGIVLAVVVIREVLK